MLMEASPPHERSTGPAEGACAHIALVRPPAISSPLAYHVGIVPPLGLAYVAAALEAAGHRVSVTDALGEAPLERSASAHPLLVAHGLTIAAIVARIPSDAQGIGVSVMFSQQWPHVVALLRAVRAAFPHVPIFLGSEHATATWQFILETCPEVTLCVLGEGEETVVEIAEWVRGKRALDDIRGIAFRRDGRAHCNPPRQRVRAIDQIARPAWHLFPLENYLSRGYGHGVNRGRSIPMLATRGCPYQCTFCSSPAMWTTRYYVRDVREVVDEIEDYVARYHVSNVDFEDLTAFIKRDWILALCRELERRRLDITFQLPSGTRSEALDEEVLTALQRAGCRNITYAPESGSKRMLEAIKKRVRLERMLASMDIAVRLGMTVRVNMMLGLPEESRRDAWETLRFGLRLAWRGIEVPLFPFTPYPGTELYEDLRREGRAGPLSDDFLAHLGYEDFWNIRSYSRNVGPAELNVYRIGGMAVFLVLRYVRSPMFLVRTVRNLCAGRSETAVEQRLLDVAGRLAQRWRHSGWMAATDRVGGRGTDRRV